MYYESVKYYKNLKDQILIAIGLEKFQDWGTSEK